MTGPLFQTRLQRLNAILGAIPDDANPVDFINEGINRRRAELDALRAESERRISTDPDRERVLENSLEQARTSRAFYESQLGNAVPEFIRELEAGHARQELRRIEEVIVNYEQQLNTLRPPPENHQEVVRNMQRITDEVDYLVQIRDELILDSFTPGFRDAAQQILHQVGEVRRRVDDLVTNRPVLPNMDGFANALDGVNGRLDEIRTALATPAQTTIALPPDLASNIAQVVAQSISNRVRNDTDRKSAMYNLLMVLLLIPLGALGAVFGGVNTNPISVIVLAMIFAAGSVYLIRFVWGQFKRLGWFTRS